ncbi:MAG TPA: lysyl oxidase family protein [Kofleriaceae bacterium]|nr:lysyl oxidase family protein [Kofleriaceae bacterium]
MLRGQVAPFLVGAVAGAASLAACGSPRARPDADADAPDAAEVDAPVPDAPDIDAPSVDAALDGPPALPDLQFVAGDMDRVIVMGQDFLPGDCAIDEGCVNGTGTRQLLRFKTSTVNRGAGDLIVGKPPPAGMSDKKFEWSACHKHHHLKGYARYDLLDAHGVVLTGRKQAFCVSDNKQVEPGIPFPHYLCTDQGLSRGWADVYDIDVACQWLDITDVVPGTYTLRITVNPEGVIEESDTTNNVFTKQVSL